MKDLDQRIRDQASKQLQEEVKHLTDEYVNKLRKAAGNMVADTNARQIPRDAYYQRGGKVEGELAIFMNRLALLRQFTAAWLADHEQAVGDAAVKSFIDKVERLAEEVDEIRHLSGV